MNTAKLTLFDTAFLSQSPTADAFSTGITRPTVPVHLPASLWRQSLAAMDNASTGPAHRFPQVCFVLLGTLSAGSMVIAAGTLVRCLGSHDGLHTAVQTLLSR